MDDLTPRTLQPRRRRIGVTVIVVAVLVVIGVVVLNGLRDAAMFFLNADEAVAQRDSLGDKRFRLQGTVVDGTVETSGGTVTFAVRFNGVDVDVSHTGSPPELFQPGVPVVLEGHWEGDQFASDRILVKHSEVYEEDHPDRLDYDSGDSTAETGESG